VNFSIYQHFITRPGADALDNPELKVYVVLLATMVAIHFGILQWSRAVDGSTETVIRAASFQVVSIGTTTGYATHDFEQWPNLLRLLLLLLMFVGGCTGSTGGGMKVARFLIFVKAAVTDLKRVANPRAVLVVRVGDRALDREMVSNIMSFLAMYIGLFALATTALTFMGLDLTTATSAAAANIGNIGPGLAQVGPAANYADVPLPGKWLLIVCQLLGRLEIYSVMVLLLKSTWVR
jgi:trk system potassium uptake protein TrkH